MSTTQQEELASLAADVTWRRAKEELAALHKRAEQAEARADAAICAANHCTAFAAELEAKLDQVREFVEAEGCDCDQSQPGEFVCLPCRIKEVLK